MKPLAIDIYCGLGGWTEGLLAEGWKVVGFDIERHRYMKRIDAQTESVKRPGMNWSDRSKRGSKDAQFNRPAEIHPDMEWIEYPAQLVLQNALTIHGAQFKDARLIVASPPCQEYSYMAMPWSLAKQREREYLEGTRDVKDLTRLFDACFRIQREACEAAGRHIPLVVENVRGAQKWVGRAKWNFGSFYLWGDVPALMPFPKKVQKIHGTKGNGGAWFNTAETADGKYGEGNFRNNIEGAKAPGFRFDGSERSFQSASVEGVKSPGRNLSKDSAKKFGSHNMGSAADIAAELGIGEAVKQPGLSGQRDNGKGDRWFQDGAASHGSKSSARKAASAQIAKIPFVLARHIASVYRQEVAA